MALMSFPTILSGLAFFKMNLLGANRNSENMQKKLHGALDHSSQALFRYRHALKKS